MLDITEPTQCSPEVACTFIRIRIRVEVLLIIVVRRVDVYVGEDSELVQRCPVRVLEFAERNLSYPVPGIIVNAYVLRLFRRNVGFYKICETILCHNAL